MNSAQRSASTRKLLAYILSAKRLKSFLYLSATVVKNEGWYAGSMSSRNLVIKLTNKSRSVAWSYSLKKPLAKSVMAACVAATSSASSLNRPAAMR